MPRLATPTAAQFLRRYGAREIAARAGDEELDASGNPLVDGPLLQLTVDGGDRSAYTAEQQAAADRVVVRIDSLLAAGADHLRAALPRQELDWSEARAGASHALAMARYLVYDEGAPEDIRQQRDDAMAWAERRYRVAVRVATLRV